MSKPNCYDCVHRSSIPGDAHSQCLHPDRFRLEVSRDAYGVRMGWCNWPFNFDPTWLYSCSGLVQKPRETKPTP